MKLKASPTQISDSVEKCVDLPEDAAEQVRRACGIDPKSELRILFFGGPGDVVGTFNFWVKGQQDQRIPVIAYSSMFYTLCHKLRAKGYVLTESDVQPEVPADGFEFIHTPHRRGGGRIRYRIDEYKFYKSAKRTVEKVDPHVIIASGDIPNALMRAFPASARVVLTMHNAYWPMGQHPSGLRGRRMLTQKTEAMQRLHAGVCTSPECARQLGILGMRSEACLVETPQILNSFAQDRVRDPDAVARRLVFLGRIEPEKGVFDLLTAFENLAKTVPDLTLDIAGTGSSLTHLEQVASVSRFQDRIIVHGLLAAQEVHDLLRRSDLLICPTRDVEGLALVVVEASIHNVPSVVSSVVPARELFPGGCAEFQAGDIAGLTESLRGLVSDKVAFAAITQALGSQTERFFDRSLSWGSMMFKALTL